VSRFIATFLLAVVAAAAAYGQERAITQSGKAVILNPDGTWQYAPPSQEDRQADPSTYLRSPGATTRIELNRTGYQLYYDPHKWVQKKGDAGRVSFTHSTGDGYAVAISERIGVQFESLRSVALANAKAVAPDAEITFDEMRVVNGAKLLCLQIRGTIQSIRFVYFGYYYSSNAGTVQLITFTAPNLLEEYRADFEEFLNGLVVRDSEDH